MNQHLTTMRPADHGRRMLATLLRLLGLAVLLASPALYDGSVAHAAAKTFKVTRADDPWPNGCKPKDCSLREAIVDANANSGWDTILLPVGTYKLSLKGKGENKAETGDLDITDDLTLIGRDALTTIIDANYLDRVFEVSEIATVKISEVTVRKGYLVPYYKSGPIGCTADAFLIEAGGGGILNCGDLTLTNSYVVGSEVEINGGGIYNAGTLRLIDSTVNANATRSYDVDADESDGGGIYNIGTMTLTASTISHNRAWLRGGGIANFGGMLTLTNSTVSGNRARLQGGGIDNVAGSVTLNNSTVAFNTAEAVGFPEGGGGGISNNFGEADAVELSNTILARNVDTSGLAPDCLGSLISKGHNLVKDSTGCTFASAPVDLLNVDPKLGELRNNGGRTWTHELLAASPAIDAGATGPSRRYVVCASVDQRGVARPKDGNGDGTARCDIGAVERQSATTP